MTALLLGCLCITLAPASGSAAPPFAPTSIWNAPLRADAPLAPRSAALAAELRRQLATTAPWIATTGYSAPVYTVPAEQPRVRVEAWGRSAMFTNWTDMAEVQRQLWDVPLPANARPAQGLDGHVIVYQPSTDSLWEIWQLDRRPDGWHATWGGKISGVSRSDGSFGRFGATATGLSMLGGLIRIDELRRGRIDHALGFSIPHPLYRSLFAAPAARSDGDSLDPRAIPEGTRFRLDPRLDLRTLRLPRVTAIIARAVQRYGMVLRDKGGCVCFFGEDPAPTGSDPYPALFEGRGPHKLLASFPWSRLQALAAPLAGALPVPAVGALPAPLAGALPAVLPRRNAPRR